MFETYRTTMQHGTVSRPAFSSVVSGPPRKRARAMEVRRESMNAMIEPQGSLNIESMPASHVKNTQAALDVLRKSAPNRYMREKSPSIIAIGLTIHNTPVEIREKMSIPEGVREVEEWMCRTSGIPLNELRQHLFLFKDRDATSHLLRVAGGLDSLVLGEGQILSQVKKVYQVGQQCPNFGRHLNGLFKQAITAGKRVRSETSISSGAVSVSSAAAELCQMKLPSNNFNDARVSIIGAGRMSKLLVKHLVSKGCMNMTILNRSLPRAEELASEFPEANIQIRLMPEMMSTIAESDVIFVASGSETILIRGEDLKEMPQATEKVGCERRFFDISVPRNVDPDVSQIANSQVFNVDDLKEVVEANKGARAKAASEADNLLKQEQLTFEAWRDSLETVPTIKALRGKAEDIRSSEMNKALSRFGDGLTKKQMKAVEEMSKSIVNKLLHGPMTALRCDGADQAAVGETLANMDALERMFELNASKLIAGRQ